MQKREAGFRFGVNSTRLIRIIDETKHNGRLYRLCEVEADGRRYHSLRLYNEKGRFIKQLMTEREIAGEISGMYAVAATGRHIS